MAQLFCDVVIKNTGSERGDHFWDNAELNLLKALVLYVSNNYPPEKRNIGEVYQLLAMSSEKELNALFDVLPVGHPAKAPYSIFKQSSENVRGGVIIGLGSRLQVFQNQDIRNITAYDEIDLELPARSPAPITASPATRIRPLTSSPRCSCLLFLSSWYDLRTSNAPMGSCPSLSMFWGKNCVPLG